MVRIEREVKQTQTRKTKRICTQVGRADPFKRSDIAPTTINQNQTIMSYRGYTIFKHFGAFLVHICDEWGVHEYIEQTLPDAKRTIDDYIIRRTKQVRKIA